MNNFQFEKDENRQKDALDLLHSQKKKLARQQVIFASIFIVAIILLGLYILSRIIFVYYDGYIRLDTNHIRAIDDMYITEMKVNVGDSVQPGDTLFSYVLLSQVITHSDYTQEPVFITRTNDMRMQGNLAEQQLIVLRTQLAELQKQLRSESNDIYYGLTNNTKQNELKAQIEQVKAEIQETNNRVRIYLSRAGSNMAYAGRYGLFDRNQSLLPFSPGLYTYNDALIHYAVAPDKGFVTNVENPDRSLSFKGNDIVVVKYADPLKANLRVMAYVPVDQVRDLVNADTVDVVVDHNTIFKAHLVRLGLGVDQLPDYLVNNFTRDAMVIMAALAFEKGQDIPTWVLNNNLPVKIRINKVVLNLKHGGEPEKDGEMYKTRGISQPPSIPKENVPHMHE